MFRSPRFEEYGGLGYSELDRVFAVVDSLAAGEASGRRPAVCSGEDQSGKQPLLIELGRCSLLAPAAVDRVGALSYECEVDLVTEGQFLWQMMASIGMR